MLRLEYELGELAWSVLDCRQTMKPTYTRHARQQMTTRKINGAEVEADGAPIGVELLCVSDGVNVDDLPEQVTIGRLLEEHRIKVFA